MTGLRNLVFDLDGTLVDSLPGIEESLRAALAVHQPGLTFPAAGIRALVGPPLAQIIRGCWPCLADREVAELVAAYRHHYLAEGCAATKAFLGVAELLRELHAAETRLFVLTNKPRLQTEVILDRQGWTDLFEIVACPDDPQHPFSRKEAGAVDLRERAGLVPKNTMLVGDAPGDAHAARAAGFAFVAAGYGYGYPDGHGSSLDEDCPVAGDVASLRTLIFDKFPSPPPHDHPQSLR